MSAVTPLMLKTPANPGGLPMKLFDEIHAGLIANRSQLYKDIAGGAFFGFNRTHKEMLNTDLLAFLKS